MGYYLGYYFSDNFQAVEKDRYFIKHFSLKNLRYMKFQRLSWIFSTNQSVRMQYLGQNFTKQILQNGPQNLQNGPQNLQNGTKTTKSKNSHIPISVVNRRAPDGAVVMQRVADLLMAFSQ